MAVRGILILWIKFYRYRCVVPPRHRLMVGLFVSMNFVDAGVKGGGAYTDADSSITQNFREDAPRKKGAFE